MDSSGSETEMGDSDIDAAQSADHSVHVAEYDRTIREASVVITGERDHQQPIQGLQRNPKYGDPVCVPSTKYNGLSLRPNICIQHWEDGTANNIDHFFYIRSILRTTEGIVLQGWPIVRNSDHNVKSLPYDEVYEEVHVVISLPPEDCDTPLTHVACDLPLKGRIRQREIIFTNVPSNVGRPGAYREGQLVCRWLHITQRSRRTSKPLGYILRLLTSSECPGYRGTRDYSLRTRWRGQQTTPTLVNGDQSYVAADAFCGAGGASRSMHEAGLAILWAFDQDTAACNSMRANQDLAVSRIINADVHSFVTSQLGLAGWVVDILHISPPCQAYSPANPGGRNDERNIASGFCVRELLTLCKPRVVTLEQTLGFNYPQWTEYRNLYTRQFTDLGYSVRYQVINLASYGNVQSRKRFILLASSPGEPLYDLPAPTHGIQPGQRPLTTIGQVLDVIDYMAIPEQMKRHLPRDANAYAEDVPLRYCITGDGGRSNMHPSGQRTFMLQELAALQGFPQQHVFSGTDTQILQQIGNAVPPVFATKMFAHLVDCMKDEDAKTKILRQEDVMSKAQLSTTIMIED